MLIDELKVLMWACVHHPQYAECQFSNPVLFRVFIDLWEEGLRFDITIGFFLPRLYVPSSVFYEYKSFKTGRPVSWYMYDDIPF